MGDFFDPFWGQTREQAEEMLRRVLPPPPPSDQPPQPTPQAAPSGPLSLVDGQLLWLGEPIQSREPADPVELNSTSEPETVQGLRRR